MGRSSVLGKGRQSNYYRMLNGKGRHKMQKVERVLSLAPKALFSPHLYDPAYQGKPVHASLSYFLMVLTRGYLFSPV